MLKEQLGGPWETLGWVDKGKGGVLKNQGCWREGHSDDQTIGATAECGQRERGVRVETEEEKWY